MASHVSRRFWTLWGKTKLVLSQLGIYFSVLTMSGIMVTMWHTTISPILESHGLTPSPWWMVLIVGLPLVTLGVIEWLKGTPGFYRSFVELFYADDSPVRRDIEEMKKDIKEMKQYIDNLTKESKEK